MNVRLLRSNVGSSKKPRAMLQLSIRCYKAQDEPSFGDVLLDGYAFRLAGEASPVPDIDFDSAFHELGNLQQEFERTAIAWNSRDPPPPPAMDSDDSGSEEGRLKHSGASGCRILRGAGHLWGMRFVFLLGLLVAWELKASATSTALAPSLEALAQALRGDEQQARQRLAKEAEKLREDRDARAAELLQRLSEGAYESRDKPKVFSSSSTVESHTLVDHNGERVEVRHQKNCRNGVCSEQTDTAHPKHKEEPSASAMSLGAGMHHGQAHHVDIAARDMARELRAMEQQMDSNFNMDDIFQPAQDLFWQRFRDAPPVGASRHEQHTESMSEETVVKNGRAVHRTRRCQNGKCQTTLEEGDVGSKSGPEEPSKIRGVSLEW
eukprot:s119_g16.t2